MGRGRTRTTLVTVAVGLGLFAAGCSGGTIDTPSGTVTLPSVSVPTDLPTVNVPTVTLPGKTVTKTTEVSPKPSATKKSATKDTPAKSSGMPLWLIILIAALVGALLVYWVNKRKQDKAAQEQARLQAARDAGFREGVTGQYPNGTTAPPSAPGQYPGGPQGEQGPEVGYSPRDPNRPTS